jgi:hypothetical protein
MSRVHRLCRTCRHFAPAPLLGKGWCRNPVLYAESHQHLVDAGDLDCERAFGDFWEADPSVTPPPEPAAAAGVRPVGDLIPGLRRVRLRGLVATLALIGLVAVAVPRLEAWWEAPPSPTPSLPRMTPALVASLAPETTPAPALPPPTATPVPTAPPAPTATPAPSPTPAVAELPALSGPLAAPEVRPSPEPARTAAASLEAPKPSLRAGMKAVVATGDEAVRLRLRQAPGTGSPIMARIENGEAVRIIAGPRQAGAEVWWQVDYAGKRGWVAGAFLKPLAGG